MSNAEDLRKTFNVTYFLLLSPFRFSKGKIGNHKSSFNSELIITRSWFQTALCGLLTVLDFIWMVFSIRICVPFDNANNPQAYFNLFGIVISQIGKCIMIKRLWFDSERFLSVVNHTCENFKPIESTKRNVYIMALICCATVVSFTNIFRIQAGSKRISQNFSFHGWWSDLVMQGRKVYFLDTIQASNLTDSSLEVVVGILTALGFLHRDDKIKIRVEFNFLIYGNIEIIF